MSGSQPSSRGTTRVAVFATFFVLSDTAKRELAGRFEASKEGRKAELQDRASTTVTDYTRRHHPSEQTLGHETLQNTEVERAPGTLISQAGDAKSDPESSSETAEIKNEVDKLIDFDPVVKEWSNGSMGRELDILKGVENLTGCRLEPKGDRKTIVVRGYNDEDVEKAIKKLDMLWASTSQQSTLPITYDFSVTEGETNVMLRMVPLKSFNDRRLATTLISLSHKLSRVLSSQLALVMIKDGQFFPIAQPRPIERDDSPEYQGKLWEGYVPQPYNIGGLKNGQLSGATQCSNAAGQDNNDSAPTAHFTPYLAASKTDKISKWVEESAARSASDPFKPSVSEVQEVKQGHAQRAKANQTEETRKAPQTRESTLSQPLLPQSAKKARKAAGGAAVTTTVETSQSVAKIAEMTSAESSSATGHPADISQANEAPKTPSSRASISTQHVSQANAAPRTPSSRVSISTQHVSQVSGASKTPSSRASISNAPGSRARLPELNPPYLPSRSNTSSIKSRAEPTPDWASSVITTAQEGRLIDFGEAAVPANKAQGRVQQRNEVASRNFRNTMRQRKSPAATLQTNTGATLAYDAAATSILKLVRSVQGNVEIQTTIGRFFIDNKSGSNQWRKSSFAIAQWHDVFPNKQGHVRFDVHMTDRITTRASDIDFIVDLRLSSGRQMFVKEPCERKIYYSFTCSALHKEDDEVIVQVDAKENGEFTIYSASKLFGSINWHFPRRYWDASLTVRASRPSSLQQRQAATSLVENLHVVPSEDQKSISLCTNIPSKALTIKSVQLRRETHHRSVIYPDLLLRLSEVEELGIEPPAFGNDQECRAYSKPRKQMVSEDRLWWEASLFSASAARAFTENKTLELGETAKWTVQGLIDGGVVKRMSFLARDVVTRIDSVGYHNKGPKGVSTKPQTQMPVSIADPGFW
ncbi:MAG: hypothetical protein Q9191_003862 [Dirinaria sp. TL-2023a]